jgi:hypothetical protein
VQFGPAHQATEARGIDRATAAAIEPIEEGIHGRAEVGPLDIHCWERNYGALCGG